MSKRQGKKKNRILLVVIELVIILLLLGGVFVYLKADKVKEGQVIKKEELKLDKEVVEKEVSKGYTNVVLFGLDNRSNGSYAAGNSDVIIIASINNDTQEVKLVSVYRDTYLNLESDIDEDMYNKCNEAYQKGGVTQALRMVDRNLDLDITKYVCFDFNAVAECVDQMGGVEIEITDEEAHLMIGYMEEISEMTGKQSVCPSHGGVYNLDGVQATAYARIRYTAGNDYKRTERQRLVIEKLFEKAKASNISTLNSIVDTMLEYIETNLSVTDILALASKVTDYSIADTTGFPFEKTTTYVGKMDCVVACDLETNVKELHNYLFGNAAYEPSSTVKNISEHIRMQTGLGVEDANQ